MEYRVEQKYLITEERIAYLKQKLENCMQYDGNAAGESYLIRSLYFDDMYDTCLKENEAGTDIREKFRIRTYDNDSSLIHLELKQKRKGFTKKQKERLTKEECLSFMEGKSSELKKEDGFLKKKLYSQGILRRMQPVQIVEYERMAFVEPMGNVRVTFDKNIGGTADISTFFDEYIPTVPAMPTGVHILEVKYDEFLPDYIKEILEIGSLRKTSFSKYYYTRVNENI